MGPFLAKDEHNAFTGCGLPPWLPDTIVADLNKRFGGQLSSELLQMMEQTSLEGNRHSVDSQGLSINSIVKSSSIGLVNSKTLGNYFRWVRRM
jgi:hypothetical protein